METILDKILFERKKQLKVEKEKNSQVSLIKTLNKKGLQIIGEIKRSSPSKGQMISENFNMEKQLGYYVKNSVSAFSILTEQHYFKGSSEDLIFAKNLYPNIPILRKDFIFEPFQIAHAKFLGASAVLLIVKMLSDTELIALHNLALSLELEVLVEIHDEDDLNRALKIPNLALLGINNRDLNTFKTSLSVTEKLLSKIKNSENITIISESGFNTKEELSFIESLGVSGVLIGEALMKGYLL
ncbi:MAG: indole-3-glycerol-phosphate synthase [Sebaldella sp.]|nr:indole-3-glycerol-phosphate synthase [Sebaldella sp.]